jgi:FlaG/FlaF family flagellin (archaellin)
MKISAMWNTMAHGVVEVIHVSGFPASLSLGQTATVHGAVSQKTAIIATALFSGPSDVNDTQEGTGGLRLA